ncbi:hypothetical protein ADL00_45800 [Streptomyces sp. AS58]|uniref:hypothetical protein n=1 Tax=Streptomyces sp. AS58 TaxID=1519489 RepID=UPI0006AFC0F0|nr:hypothetical protein [Streptomyces sp. AS58]KOV49385.1 hypothetical protein ADL00_45800 [Streptomyces sp. AS58]
MDRDEQRQLNVQADGKPWHTSDLAASTTDTNQDGKSDDVAGPYLASASSPRTAALCLSSPSSPTRQRT